MSVNKNDEQILVVEREVLFDGETSVFQGYQSVEDFKPIDIDTIQVKRRGDMEIDPTFKQIITYAVIRDKATKDVLLYKRLGGSGETRLVDKTSIGVGGHTNHFETDTVDELLFENFIRELDEELNIGSEKTYSLVGYINDDSNEVGEVHIGAVYVVEVDKDTVSVNETDTLAIDWLTVEQIKQDDKLESWSKLLIENDEFVAKLV